MYSVNLIPAVVATLVVTLTLFISASASEEISNALSDSNQCKNSKNVDLCLKRQKRDAPGLSAPDADNLDNLYNTLSNLRVARARPAPFLGKRAPRYMLGKRPRNNFLGKRDGSDLSDAIPLLDYLEQEATQQEKRMRPFLGKKARPMLGKRANYDLGSLFDDEVMEDALAEEKRGRNRAFLGKRGRNQGRPFLGKRDDDDMLLDEMDNDVDKRERRPFLGKRGRRPFLGKRSDDMYDEDEDMKRAARYMLGKRDATTFDDDDMDSVRRR